MPTIIRRHRLPHGIELHCLTCGTRTLLTIQRLCEDDTTPCCLRCQAPLDPRIERDVRAIARAVESITHFLPEGTLVATPMPEKAWAVGLALSGDAVSDMNSPASSTP